MRVETERKRDLPPAGWRRLRLADAGQWRSGGTPSTSNDAYWGGDIPWISGASMKDFHVTDAARRLTLLGAKNGSRLAEPGTTLFVVRGMSLKSEFRIGVAERQVAFGQDVKALIPADGIDPHFLAYAIRVLTPEILSMVEETSHGTGRLDTARLKELEIGVPSMDEQRRIVAVHTAFERRIGALERDLGKLDALRRGLRDGGVSGPLTQLGEVLVEKPKNGYSPSEVQEWTGLLALGLGCLTSEGFAPRQLKQIPNSPVARRFRLADGDLLMSRANTRELVGLAGRYQDVGQSCIYPDLMMRLRPDEQRCLSAYLEMALASSSVRAAVQAEARGTSESMVKISAGVVEALHIPLPSLERQREVVEASALLDDRIVKQQAVIAKLRTVQQGVCEDLLGGQRAPEPTSSVS
ncbi:restriction endonuclease subunit S [Streptomyces sp. NBC_01358]|uniref:restriction endonuclease subunit S n=1 Tax=Streptomyces sp. NBC_01358 TaxID=2903837 RepID=UPI002E374978|nr:restriction endonuclease subunit S [Streptomyces sp. NBC_01358]